MAIVENDNHVSEDSLKLFVVLSKAYASVSEAVLKDIRRYGLNPTEFAVLELLYHKGIQPIQKIREKVLLKSNSITYTIDKLEEKKYIERKGCSKDRRVTYVTLTERGKEKMQSIFPSHEEAIKKILKSLSGDEKKEAIRLLKKIGLGM
ncbi:MarR family winged helix-turn-helix transcriptional regulator [Tindallia californiensis]|uniref:MarR family transcriptional regulator, 2-MHQ and catechol-resistance regulon repressor n=1 Tax=Tindallia californiensis TaxID=159292 RepID=A0A1H3MRX7_9FIRM|nr:MarR family transcriptional regulator [Tindallia californiensis]SDY79214.1 MarR family transcriptional regulator, 2-MHQ and catechol-resistance regulon repressor [Tindallia californiensis]